MPSTRIPARLLVTAALTIAQIGSAGPVAGEASGQGGDTPARAPAPARAEVPRPLREIERMWAEAAWAYFESMTAPATGLVPARAGAPYASMWSVGDQVAALVAGRRLEIVEPLDFDRRFSAILGFLNAMPLAFGQLPNRLYNVETGASVGGDFEPGVSGWSAVDLGRLLVWLRIAAEEYPFYEPYIRNALLRLNVCWVADDERRLLAANGPAVGERVPETARGYDSYAAQGFRAWGLDLPMPELEPPSFEIEIEGVRFPTYGSPERRAPLALAAPSYMGFELGFEPIGAEVSEEEVAGGRPAEALIEDLHVVHEGRFLETGIHGARADFRRASEPFWVYDTVLSYGYPWSTTDQAGAAHPRLALVSTRGAIALATFFDSDYAAEVFEVIRPLYDQEAGWGEGRYEVSGAHERTRTSATNAFVLEALAYRELGPLFPEAARPEALGEEVVTARNVCRLPRVVEE